MSKADDAASDDSQILTDDERESFRTLAQRDDRAGQLAALLLECYESKESKI